MQIFDLFPEPIPEIYDCYMDNCFGATSVNRQQLINFVSFDITLHQALEFVRTTFLSAFWSSQPKYSILISPHMPDKKPLTATHTFITLPLTLCIKSTILYVQFLRIQ